MAGRARTWVAAGTATLLVGLGTVFAAPTEAAELGGLCAGEFAPRNTTGGNHAPVLANDTIGALAGGTRTIEVLGNDTDPDGDELFVVSASTPSLGDVCVDDNGNIEYFAVSSAPGYSEQFTYGVTDGDLYRTATVTVNVKGIKPLRAQLVHRKVRKHKARIRFTNENDRNMVVLAGVPNRPKPLLTRTIPVGKSVNFRTKHKRIVWFGVVHDLDGLPIFVNLGNLNTRTGAQTIINGDELFFRQHPRLKTLSRQWLGRARR